MLDRFIDETAIEVVGLPGARESTGNDLWAVGLLDVIEAHPHRHRDAFADDDRLLPAQGRQLGRKPMRVLGQRRVNERLVAVVRHSEGEQRAALRQDRGVDFRRPLTYQAQRDAIFPPLFGDPLDRAPGRCKTLLDARGNIAMGLLADEQNRRRLVVIGPDGEIEDDPADQRDDDVDDLRRHTGQIKDRQWLALHRDLQDSRHQTRQFIADANTGEQELIAPVAFQMTQPFDQADIGPDPGRTVRPGHGAFDQF